MGSKNRIPGNRDLGREIAERVVEQCRDKGMSLSQLAKAVGMPPSRLSEWRNQGHVPSAAYLLKLSDTLGVTTDWLLGVPGAAKHRGAPLTAEQREAQIFEMVQRALTADLPPNLGEFAGEARRPIQQMAEGFREKVSKDPDYLRREMFALSGDSRDERRSLLTAMLALELFTLGRAPRENRDR
jgi:transcriptional regulator with XRE-family HTH domain